MAAPHNEYFSVQFLLAFPVTGLHQVVIETSIVDAEGARWNTGPRATLLVKSYDETLQRQQQLQSLISLDRLRCHRRRLRDPSSMTMPPEHTDVTTLGGNAAN